jgi:hypothetical protein
MRLELKDLDGNRISVTHNPCCNKEPREIGSIPDFMIDALLTDVQRKQYIEGKREFIVRSHIVEKIQFTI